MVSSFIIATKLERCGHNRQYVIFCPIKLIVRIKDVGPDCEADVISLVNCTIAYYGGIIVIFH